MTKHKHTFVKDDAGIRKLLKSQECLEVMEKESAKIEEVNDTTSFIGFDRAKVFVETTEEVAARYR